MHWLYLCATIFGQLMHVIANFVAFGKSTSQRIYPKQHTPKIG